MIGVFVAVSDMAAHSTSNVDGKIVSRRFDC